MEVKNFLESNYVTSPTVLVKEALAAISDNHRGAVLIIDEEQHLLGVLSDGDIRRALLRGSNILSPIKDIINQNPVKIVVNGDQPEMIQTKIEGVFHNNTAITLLPVVDHENKLVSVYTQN